MMQVYFDQGIPNKKAVFEVYFRQTVSQHLQYAGLEKNCTLS